MILSHLPTKDLARSLVVLKHWQRSSLAAVVLRRKLFLFPNPKREYLMYDPDARGDRFRISSVLLREPCSISRPIHEPHPILLPHSDSTGVISIEIRGVPYQALRTVDPETFLFQPPLNDVQVYYEYSGIGISIHYKLGMTFGQLIKEIDELRALYTHHNKDKDETCRVRHSGAVPQREPREFLEWVGPTEQWFADSNYTIALEPTPGHIREIVNPHPMLIPGVQLESYRTSGNCGAPISIAITLPRFSVLRAAPSSAFLTQRPTERISYDHWGQVHNAHVPGGVTFGAILEAVEERWTRVKTSMVHSPRFAEYQYGIQDQRPVHTTIMKAVLSDAAAVKRARKTPTETDSQTSSEESDDELNLRLR